MLFKLKLKSQKIFSYAIYLLLLMPIQAFASQTGTDPWDIIFDKIVKSLTGPIAYSIVIMAIVVCGAVMAFEDLQGGAKVFVRVACGASLIFFAGQIATSFFGFNGAVI